MTLEDLLYEIRDNQIRQIELLEDLLQKGNDEKPYEPQMTRKELREMRNQIQQYTIETKQLNGE